MWPSVLAIGIVGTLLYLAACARRRVQDARAAEAAFNRHRAAATIRASLRSAP